jgi:uncharacterized protein YndB with AHSA1/START domain
VAERVELQAEIEAPRAAVFELVASADGLGRWLDGAELEPSVGGAVQLTLRDAVAQGRVLAIDPPQHISFTWDWLAEPLGVVTVVAFDAIDHGARTHLTVRHIGLPARQLALHDELWRYWLARLVAAARSLPSIEAPADRS